MLMAMSGRPAPPLARPAGPPRGACGGRWGLPGDGARGWHMLFHFARRRLSRCLRQGLPPCAAGSLLVRVCVLLAALHSNELRDTTAGAARETPNTKRPARHKQTHVPARGTQPLPPHRGRCGHGAAVVSARAGLSRKAWPCALRLLGIGPAPSARRPCPRAQHTPPRPATTACAPDAIRPPTRVSLSPPTAA